MLGSVKERVCDDVAGGSTIVRLLHVALPNIVLQP